MWGGWRRKLCPSGKSSSLSDRLLKSFVFSPRYDSKTDLLSMSYTKFKKQDIGILGRIILRIFHTLRLIDLKENIGENEDYIECSNMTIITLLLKALGPTHECSLTIYLLVIQVRQ